MKRKTLISVLAILFIALVSLLGELFCAKGVWLDALINFSLKFLPFLILFITSITMVTKKGGYSSMFRVLGWISFVASICCLFLLSKPFMHYFNVMNNQEQVKQSTKLAIEDYSKMFNEYEETVSSRVNKYMARLRTAIAEKDNALLYAVQNSTTKTVMIDLAFANKAVDAWKESMFTRHAECKRQWEGKEGQKAQYLEGLTTNFNMFTSAKLFDGLVSLYDSYKEKLSETYASCNPIEEYDIKQGKSSAPSLEFENKEKDWKKTQRLFVVPTFNLLFFILFIILAALASFAFFFIKIELVKRPKKSDGSGVYREGIPLKNINN